MKRTTISSLILVFSVLLCSCGPSYASKNEILKYARSEAKGENLEIEREIKEHTYMIRSLDRDLQFTASTHAGELSCDGSSFGYSGEYYIHTDYYDAIYRYWYEETRALLEEDGFDWVRFDRNEDSARTFTFYIDADVPQEDLEKIEEFMFGLREILKKEQEFHNKNIDICYHVAIHKHLDGDDEKAYHRCAGNDGYSTRITSETPDIELDIQRMGHEANAWIENTQPEKTKGVIMMYNEDNT
ncbi:MAG: hypothetical protein J5636_08780 [Clostridiales bacterium]|nr:hypothetical protein [Clostridiales bacterium]